MEVFLTCNTELRKRNVQFQKSEIDRVLQQNVEIFADYLRQQAENAELKWKIEAGQV